MGGEAVANDGSGRVSLRRDLVNGVFVSADTKAPLMCTCCCLRLALAGECPGNDTHVQQKSIDAFAFLFLSLIERPSPYFYLVGVRGGRRAALEGKRGRATSVERAGGRRWKGTRNANTGRCVLMGLAMGTRSDRLDRVRGFRPVTCCIAEWILVFLISLFLWILTVSVEASKQRCTCVTC